MRNQVGDDVVKVADLVHSHTKTIKNLKRDVVNQRDVELKQEGVTQGQVDQINAIVETAKELAVTGGTELVESLQACKDYLL